MKKLILFLLFLLYPLSAFAQPSSTTVIAVSDDTSTVYTTQIGFLGAHVDNIDSKAIVSIDGGLPNFTLNATSTGDANIVQLVNDTTALLGTTSAGGGGDTKLGQSFTLANTTTIAGVFVYTDANSGTPLGNVTCRIETMVGGVPSGTLVDANATKTLTNQEFVQNATNYFLFTAFNLVAGQYAIVLQCDSQTVNKGWNVKNSSTNQYAGGTQHTKIGAGAWATQAGKDLMFTLDTGGVIDYIQYQKSTDPVWTVGLYDNNSYKWMYGSGADDLKMSLTPAGNIYLSGNLGVSGLPTGDDLRVYGYSNLSAVRSGQNDLHPAIVFAGDSITVGTLGGGNAWTDDIVPDPYGGDITWTLTNLGIAGATVKNLRFLMPSYNDYMAYDEGLNIFGLWAGTNDLLPYGVSQTYGYYEMMCKQLRERGWKVIAFTTISRATIESPVNLKVQYNNLIRANWSDFADILCDVAGNANLGADGAYANLTYFADGIHPTQAGNDIISTMVQACVDSLTTEHDVHIAGALAIGKLFPNEELDVKGNAYISGNIQAAHYDTISVPEVTHKIGIKQSANTMAGGGLVWEEQSGSNWVGFYENSVHGLMMATGTNSSDATDRIFLDSDGDIISLTGFIQSGYAGIDGEIRLYSEQGATDYRANIFTNTAMTSDANFYFPADEPAATSLMTMTTGGVITNQSTSAGLAGALSDETGFSAGALAVFSTSPTLTTPNIGAATGTSLNVTGGGLVVSTNGQTLTIPYDASRNIVYGSGAGLLVPAGLNNMIGIAMTNPGTGSPAVAYAFVSGAGGTNGLRFNYTTNSMDFTRAGTAVTSVYVNNGATSGLGLTTNYDAQARCLLASGDNSAGLASNTTFTNATNTTVTNTYLVKGGQAANTVNTGWIKIYIGTTVAWVPYFANATP